MVDVSAAFATGRQAYSILTFFPTLTEFRKEQNFITGYNLLNVSTGVFGIEPVLSILVRHAVEIGLHVHEEALHAANDMVTLMQSRVPVDTGRLYNGFKITENDDGSVSVSSEAVHPGADHNYARDTEFGRGAHAVADSSFFDDTDNAGSALRPRTSRGDGSEEPHPFFLNSFDEVNEQFHDRLRVLASDGLR